jgi:hypothetical protein
LETGSGTVEIAFMRNLFNSLFLSTAAVILALILACRRPTPSRG